jgi:hypothetical protein
LSLVAVKKKKKKKIPAFARRVEFGAKFLGEICTW